MGPESNDRCPCEGDAEGHQTENTESYRGQGAVKVEAEMGIIRSSLPEEQEDF